MIAIVDYGSGNLHSAAKAFERAAREQGADQPVVVTSDPDQVRGADRIVLPGVGAFADCRRGLDAVPGMVDALHARVRRDGRPFLGICVGMQLMAERGREYEVTEGLGWIPGEVDRITPGDPDLKIPHMGWNTLNEKRRHPLFDGIALGNDGLHGYFVHSYQLRPSDRADLIAEAEYGGPITAIVARDTFAGTQFHPEKSQKLGLALIAGNAALNMARLNINTGFGFLARRFRPHRRHDLDVGLRSKPRRHGGLGRGQQRAAFFARLLLVLLFAFQAPGGLLDLVVEIDLGAKAQGHGILRRQVGGIPMRAIADGGDRRLGRADQPHDLTVLQFGVIAQQPNDGIWPILAARDGGVARSLLGLDLGDLHFRGGQAQDVSVILLATADFLAAQLAVGNRIHALDAVGNITVGDAFDLQRMQATEFRDLLKRQGRILHKPNGCGLGHQRFAIAHGRAFVPTGAGSPCRPIGEKCAEKAAYSPGRPPHATGSGPEASSAATQHHCTAARCRDPAGGRPCGHKSSATP